MIAGFRRDVYEICALVRYYAAFSGSYIATFRDNLAVPSSRAKKCKKKAAFFLGQNYDSVLRNMPEDRRSPLSFTRVKLGLPTLGMQMCEENICRYDAHGGPGYLSRF